MPKSLQSFAFICLVFSAVLSLGVSAPAADRSIASNSKPTTGHCEAMLLVKPATRVETFSRVFVKTILGTRYTVRTEGLDKVVAKGRRGVLIVSNHPGYIDPVIQWAALQKDLRAQPTPIREMYDALTKGVPFGQQGADKIEAIAVPSPVGRSKSQFKKELDEFFDKVDSGLREGRNYFLYASGTLYRTMYEQVGSSSAVWEIRKRFPEVRIVLSRIEGLWGSSFTTAQNNGELPPLKKMLASVAKAPAVAGWNLMATFIPGLKPLKREVKITYREASDLPTSDKRSFNVAMTDFFNEGAQPATFVPYFPWQKHRIIPEPKKNNDGVMGAPEDVSPEIRNELQAIMRTVLKDESATFKLTDDLVDDIGMDSLNQLELIMAMETAFGFKGDELAGVKTFGDLLLVAAGQKTVSSDVIEIPKAPKGWVNAQATGRPLTVPRGDNLLEVIRAQAVQNPDRIVYFDLARGPMTYRKIMTGINFLTPIFAQFRSKYVGTLFPASTGSVIVNLAVMNALKTPHAVNFKAGEKNLAATIEKLIAEMKKADPQTDFKIVTAKLVVQRLEGNGEVFPESVKKHFFYLEDLEAAGTRFKRAMRKGSVAALRTWFFIKTYLNKLKLKNEGRINPYDQSVVLATTGSEKAPKLVPLTHRNQLTNIQDAVKLIQFNDRDVLLSMLPPFHSFGFTATSMMNMALGIPTVAHPDPRQVKVLAGLIEEYGVTILAGTQTFIRDIYLAAEPGQLQSVRVIVLGAEKVQDETYALLNKVTPKAQVLEGYGVTEASPFVSVNPLDGAVPGTIGEVFPSVEYVLVNAMKFEQGIMQPVAAGEQGRLLLRGPSIFNGYLGQEKSPFVEYNGKSDWYDTGDLVVEVSKNHLKFIARLKRMYKPGGEMVSIEAIEDTLTSRYATAEEQKPIAVVVVGKDDSSRVIVYSKVPGVTVKAVNQALSQAGFPSIVKAFAIEEAEVFPELSGGLKTDYTTLAKMAAEKHAVGN